MDTFERLRRQLASWYGIGKETITPQSTIGDLVDRAARSPEDGPALPASPSDRRHSNSLERVERTMAVEALLEEFGVQVSEKDTETLDRWIDRDVSLQEIAAFIDSRR
jgi:hypothetical protein